MSNREEFVQKIKSKIDEIDAQISLLEAKAKGAEADMRIKYADEIKEMKEKRAETEEKLSKLKASSSDAWKELKAGLEEAWGVLDKSIKSAKERFKD